jgi:hypothetical protein
LICQPSEEDRLERPDTSCRRGKGYGFGKINEAPIQLKGVTANLMDLRTTVQEYFQGITLNRRKPLRQFRGSLEVADKRQVLLNLFLPGSQVIFTRAKIGYIWVEMYQVVKPKPVDGSTDGVP